MFKIVDGVRTNLTSAEIAELQAGRAAEEARRPDNMRMLRNGKLAESDWTHTSDFTPELSAEIKANWTEYRQALRDLTAHKNWPNLEDADWPTAP